MSLEAAARRRYARQLLLGEIGEVGQKRLLTSSFRRGPECDADVFAVAAEYLHRAGCPADDAQGAIVRGSTSDDVTRVAGRPALRAPAIAVLGAFAAVEQLKQALGIGKPIEFPPDLTLGDGS